MKKLESIIIKFRDSETIICCLSYLTLFGWISAFVLHDTRKSHNPLCVFHLRQALGINLIFSLGYLLLTVLNFLPYMTYLFLFCSTLIYALLLFFYFVGIKNSVEHNPKELPYIGKYISFYLKDVFYSYTQNSHLESFECF